MAAGVPSFQVARRVYATAPPTTGRNERSGPCSPPDALLSPSALPVGWPEPDVAAPIGLSLPHSPSSRLAAVWVSRCAVPDAVGSPHRNRQLAAQRPLPQARMVAMAACHQRLTT